MDSAHVPHPHLTYDQRYKAEHREYFARKQREYLAKIPAAELKQRKAADYNKHRAKRLEYQRNYIAANKERLLQVKAEYRKRNRERLRSSARLYYSTHLVEHAVNRDKRRARLLNIPGSYTPQEWLALIKAHDFRCAYCGERRPLVGDHRIPLARPELNPTNDIGNILPACRPCNGRKYNRTEEEYRAILGAMG